MVNNIKNVNFELYLNKSIMNNFESKLVSKRYPSISEIIPPAKNLKIVSIRHQLLNILINFGWFLRLSSPITKNNITCGISLIIIKIAFITNKTSFLRMLKIKSMSFSNFIINSFFNPIYCINNFISPLFLHRVDCPLKLCVYYPYKKKSLFLQFCYRNLLDQLVTQT